MFIHIMQKKVCINKNRTTKHEKSLSKRKREPTPGNTIQIRSPYREKKINNKNVYLRFVGGVDCCAAGLAPNQLSIRPIGVACNERLSTVFSALFCKFGVRNVA
jgi:hypothetical protein